jgi:hypothetical protein
MASAVAPKGYQRDARHLRDSIEGLLAAPLSLSGLLRNPPVVGWAVVAPWPSRATPRNKVLSSACRVHDERPFGERLHDVPQSQPITTDSSQCAAAKIQVIYLRDYPEGVAGPQHRRGHIDDIGMAESVSPSTITTEAIDAPSIVIFDLDQYVQGMFVQTDVHGTNRSASCFRPRSTRCGHRTGQILR